MSIWVIGIDLGGTNIKGALVNEKGESLLFSEVLTEAHKGRGHVLEKRLLPFIESLKEKAREYEIEPVLLGLGVASPLDPWEGVVYHPPNLPGWGVFPLLSFLRERLGLPVVMDNDANLFTLGEWKWGAGGETSPLLGLTLGTGIGGGIVFDQGRIWHGRDGCGGELGHITIETDGPLCNCGNRGCLEVMASATALERWVREKMEKGVETCLRSLLHPPKAKEIAQAAQNGDKLSFEAFEWVGSNLGTGIASLANILDPGVVVIGGGLSKAGMLILKPTLAQFRKRSLKMIKERVELRLASLGEMGGVLGAAYLALKNLKEEQL